MSVWSLFPEKDVRFTKSQKKVVEYISDNYEEAIFLTATQLSRKAGVSEATVARLAQLLGFDGYAGLQKALRKNFQNRLSSFDRLEETIKHVKNEQDALVKVMQDDITNISKTLQEIPIETFRQAIDDMKQATRIFVVGFMGSYAPASLLVNYLRWFKRGVQLVPSGHNNHWEMLYDINGNDLLIGITFPRYSKSTREILEFAKERGSKVGIITNSEFAEVSRYAHWVLPVRYELDAYMVSYTATVSLVNALLTAMSVQNPEETKRALKMREEVWADKVFLQTDIYDDEERSF